MSERSTSRALDADGWPHIKRTGESAGARCTESNRIGSNLCRKLPSKKMSTCKNVSLRTYTTGRSRSAAGGRWSSMVRIHAPSSGLCRLSLFPAGTVPTLFKLSKEIRPGMVLSSTERGIRGRRCFFRPIGTPDFCLDVMDGQAFIGSMWLVIYYLNL